MDLTGCLLRAQVGDATIRKEAEAQLGLMQQQNPSLFLVVLSTELSNEEKPRDSRRLAGIMLKNAMYSDSPERKAQLREQWLAGVSQESRAQIKMAVLQTLHSEQPETRHTAAIVIGKIAGVELPERMWPELIPGLLNNMAQNPSDGLRHSTLEAFGFVCEDVDPKFLEEESRKILMAVTQGMSKTETNNEVKRAAVQALLNSLEFARSHFDVPAERDFIMAALCECSQWQSDVLVRRLAFESFNKVASLYYHHLQPYIQVLYQLTSQAIVKEDESVCLQALEFWTTIGEVEAELMADEAEGVVSEDDITNQRFVENAFPFLAPEVLKALMRQEEDQDELSTWNPSMAAGQLVRTVAELLGDRIVGFVGPFIDQNIAGPDWHQREAAAIALGSIVEGPTDEMMNPLISKVLAPLFHHLADEEDLVRDTATWTVGRILTFVPRTVVPMYLEQIIQAMGEAMQDSAGRVVANACWAIGALGKACEPQNYPLTPYFQNLLAALLLTADREGVPEARGSAYDAINSVIESTTEENIPTVKSLIPVLLARLSATFEARPLSTEEEERVIGSQCLLTSALQSIVVRLGTGIAEFSDDIMQQVLRVLRGKDSRLLQDALLVISSIADGVGPDFAKYAEHVMDPLMLALKVYDEADLVAVAVGAAGDVARAMHQLILPYSENLALLLLQALGADELDKDVKPDIINCFADIALALQGEFYKFLPVVMEVMQKAAAYEFNYEDEELAEYANSLHEAIFAVYTAIMHGLHEGNRGQLFLPYADTVVRFALLCFMDGKHNETVVCASVSVLGDLAHVCGSQVKQLLTIEHVTHVIKTARSSDVKALKDAATWTRDVIRQL